METIIQIEQSRIITQVFTVEETPVWKFKLWNVHVKHLPFMVEFSKFPQNVITVGGVIIDWATYLKVPTLAECKQYEMTWFIDGPTIYIHFADHNPPFVFFSFQMGTLYGYTNKEPMLLNNLQYVPDALSIPEIEVSADFLRYSRMKFNSGSVQINNDKGTADGIMSVFGNVVNILSVKNNKTELLLQFYISKYSINSRVANFTVKDRREKLSYSAPNKFFNEIDHPDMEEKYWGKPIPDAYGKCKGVNAICIDRMAIYNGEPYNSSNYKNYYTFKVARTITSIERVQVKMKDKNGNDLWTEVFPGLGIEGNENLDIDPVTNFDKNLAWNTINPKPIRIGGVNIVKGVNNNPLPPNDGTIEIWWTQAMKDTGPGRLDRRNGNANDVKIDGVFNPQTNPGEIVKDMLVYYGDMQYDDAYFNMQEWEEEFGLLPDIGIALDSSKSIYDWIEQIQNGCLVGWQLIIDKDKFSARMDNPNREETFNITKDDIMNIHDVEVELDGENYATYTKIKYNYDYSDKEWKDEVDRSLWNVIMDLYQFDKVYENESLFPDQESAIKKGKMILEDFSSIRPVIRNIELDAERWIDIKLFETGYIDLTIEMPERLKTLQQYIKDRNFMGKFRCQIIGKRINLLDEKVFIDVRQRDAIGVNDITGEYANTNNHLEDYDNMYSDTPIEDFENQFDGGNINGYN